MFELSEVPPARLTLDEEWRRRAAMWLQQPGGPLAPPAWLVVLLPEFVDARLRLPDGAVHLFHELTWTAPLPPAFDVEPVVLWASPRNDATDVALQTTATLDGELLARTCMVARVPGELSARGERVVPKAPVLEEPTSRSQLIVDDGQVGVFADISNISHRLHDDIGYAWRAGYANILVQGLLLAKLLMLHAQAGDRGHARFWFKRPVTAGALLTVEAGSVGDRAVLVVRNARNDVAAVASFDVAP